MLKHTIFQPCKDHWNNFSINILRNWLIKSEFILKWQKLQIICSIFPKLQIYFFFGLPSKWEATLSLREAYDYLVCPEVEKIFLASIWVQNLKWNSIKILDLAAHLQIEENQWQLDLAFRCWNISLIWHVWMKKIKNSLPGTKKIIVIIEEQCVIFGM